MLVSIGEIIVVVGISVIGFFVGRRAGKKQIENNKKNEEEDKQ